MINIVGHIIGTSGYDVHTRQLANALNKLVNVKLITQVQPGQEKLLSDKELEMCKRKDGEINLIITNPIYWKLYTNNKRNWAYMIWEGDKIPISFYKECLNDDIEYIFVASNHTKQAILNTAKDYTNNIKKDAIYNYLKDKIKLIPHGINLDLFYSKEKPTDKFRFLCNKGWRNMEDRGGIQYAVRAYLEEFSQSDNIEMIIKINPAYPMGDFNKLLEQVKPNRTDLPGIKIIGDALPYEHMVHLYNQANVFLSPTRAEAFNLPCLEAMACGLPVITTNFGGQTDYVNNENGWLVDGILTDIKHEVTYENCQWIIPSITELKKIMRISYDLYLNNKGEFEGKINKGLTTAKCFQWDTTASLINQLI